MEANLFEHDIKVKSKAPFAWIDPLDLESETIPRAEKSERPFIAAYDIRETKLRDEIEKIDQDLNSLQMELSKQQIDFMIEQEKKNKPVLVNVA